MFARSSRRPSGRNAASNVRRRRARRHERARGRELIAPRAAGRPDRHGRARPGTHAARDAGLGIHEREAVRLRQVTPRGLRSERARARGALDHLDRVEWTVERALLAAGAALRVDVGRRLPSRRGGARPPGRGGQRDAQRDERAPSDERRGVSRERQPERVKPIERDLARERERLGARISGSAGSDETVFSLFALKPNLAASINLLADYIRNPAFDAKELDRIKATQLTRLKAEMNNPNALATRTIAPVLFGKDHPYGIPPSGLGDADAVKAATRDSLAAFHGAWLRPDNARIFVVGDTSLKEVVKLLDASLGQWKAPTGPKPVKDFSAAIPQPQPRIILLDRPKAPQSVIVAGKVLGAKGTDSLEVLRAGNEIFGGSFLSRFNTNLRETKGWSYGVRSQISGNRDRIAFIATAPVQADRTGDSIRELQNDLRAFLTEKGVTPAELTRMANGNIRELPGSFETSGDVLGGLQNNARFGRPDNYYEKLADTYRGMTADAIDAAARGALSVDDLVYVVVGDAATVKPQLDALGLPVEVVPAAGAPAQ